MGRTIGGMKRRLAIVLAASIMVGAAFAQSVPQFDGKPVYKVGGGVTPPRAVYTPDPKYPKPARKKRIEGKVVLLTVIAADGRAHDITITRSLERGLDEAAVKAVKKWRFDPAKKNGEPVAVQINIEVNFRLY